MYVYMYVHMMYMYGVTSISSSGRCAGHKVGDLGSEPIGLSDSGLGFIELGAQVVT